MRGGAGKFSGGDKFIRPLWRKIFLRLEWGEWGECNKNFFLAAKFFCFKRKKLFNIVCGGTTVHKYSAWRNGFSKRRGIFPSFLQWPPIQVFVLPLPRPSPPPPLGTYSSARSGLQRLERAKTPFSFPSAFLPIRHRSTHRDSTTTIHRDTQKMRVALLACVG